MIGTVAVVCAKDTWSGFWLSSALGDNPDVLIVDECRADILTGNDDILAITKNSTISVPVKGLRNLVVRTPTLIVVMCASDKINLSSIDRRFVVLDTAKFYSDANQIHITGSPVDFDKLLASIKPGVITELPEPIRPVLLSAINDLGKEAGVTGVPITVEDIIGSSLGEMLLVEVLREVQLRQTRLSEGYERLRSVSVHAAAVVGQYMHGPEGYEYLKAAEAAVEKHHTLSTFKNPQAARSELKRTLELLNREIADGLADRPAAGMYRTEVSAEQMSGDVAHIQVNTTPAIPEGYEFKPNNESEFQDWMEAGWTVQTMIGGGYLVETGADTSNAKPAAQIKRYDEDNPQIEVVIADRNYGFSVRSFSEDDREWLLEVLPRQMQEIHDRAVHSTRQDIQTGMKKLLGIKS
jgi:hypothetical protein